MVAAQHALKPQPRSGLRRKLQAWMSARLPQQDRLELTQNRIYILPTQAGWMLLLTLAVLLLAAINFQINLGYLLTFMLAGAATIGMYVCHGNLRGLALQLQPPEPCFVGQDVRLHIQLHNARRRPRYGIGLALDIPDQVRHWAWQDAPAQGHSSLELRWPVSHRGWQELPRCVIETRYPLGTFRVWSYWRPHSRLLAYPQPEAAPPPLPFTLSDSDGPNTTQRAQHGDFDGLRPYRRGDTLKQISWKKSAQSDKLISREHQSSPQGLLWLDWQQSGAQLDREQRLSRLCAWVLAAHAAEQPYGLRLPQLEIPPSLGAAHQQACLQALALA